MEIQTVSTAIARTLGSLGLHVYDYGPDSPIPPAVFIYPDATLDYHATFDGAVTAVFVARFFCPSTVAAAGQASLNALISPDGAAAAIERDSTLGGVVQSAMVTGLREYGVVQLADMGTRYYSAELLIEVFA